MSDLPETKCCCQGGARADAAAGDKACSSSAHDPPWVRGCVETPVGAVLQVDTVLRMADHLGAVKARCAIGRMHYRVEPGLYAVGRPTPDSPVLVSANYKMSFDRLRSRLGGRDAWILVLDTRGINVWCAAGKGTFGTDELVNRVRMTRLSSHVKHRTLIVPQLGATGVSAIQVKKQCGFSVVWGPVHTRDLARFIAQGMKADKPMRQVTFSLAERLVLIPVEMSIALKPAAMVLLAALILSGFGPGIFSFSALVHRGFPAVLTLVSGMLAGTVLVPALLPRIPGPMFSVKGIIAGMFTTLSVGLITALHTGPSGIAALVLSGTSLSSYLAMNFTGSSPFTSATGVEYEMKRLMPFQAGALLLGIILWFWSAF
jgi:hypothetical protein